MHIDGSSVFVPLGGYKEASAFNPFRKKYYLGRGQGRVTLYPGSLHQTDLGEEPSRTGEFFGKWQFAASGFCSLSPFCGAEERGQ